MFLVSSQERMIQIYLIKSKTINKTKARNVFINHNINTQNSKGSGNRYRYANFILSPLTDNPNTEELEIQGPRYLHTTIAIIEVSASTRIGNPSPGSRKRSQKDLRRQSRAVYDEASPGNVSTPRRWTDTPLWCGNSSLPPRFSPRARSSWRNNPAFTHCL